MSTHHHQQQLLLVYYYYYYTSVAEAAMDRRGVFPTSREKAMEDREEKPKVPSSDPPDDLAELVAAEQPQLQREHQPPNISEMKPLTREAYGGGMYGAEEGRQGRRRRGDPAGGSARPRASLTQSADGPEEAKDDDAPNPKHPPPPSTGDRDLDITGQSYIQ